MGFTPLVGVHPYREGVRGWVVGVREVPPDVGGEVTEMTRAFGDRGIAGPTATAQAPAARGSRGPGSGKKNATPVSERLRSVASAWSRSGQ